MILKLRVPWANHVLDPIVLSKVLGIGKGRSRSFTQCSKLGSDTQRPNRLFVQSFQRGTKLQTPNFVLFEGFYDKFPNGNCSDTENRLGLSFLSPTAASACTSASACFLHIVFHISELDVLSAF